MRRNHYLILLIIVALAIFFRSYQAIERFEFAHDGDLYSWIVKDIIVNNHLRLIGQLTSTDGIFIGPFFYYLLIPFFLLTSMDPIGLLLLPILIGVGTVLSYYFIFKKLFTSHTGLIAAFVNAIFLTSVRNDRWVVPTMTTNIWGIWYFFAAVMISRGNFAIFPLLGFLAGLIWHINFSLAPTLIAIPAAVVMSKKIPSVKDLTKGTIAFGIPFLPYVLFEVRHNFSQTQSLLSSFITDQGGGSGVEKFYHVIHQVRSSIVGLFFFPSREIFISGSTFIIIFLVIALLLWHKKAIEKKTLVILYLWIASIILFFSFSSKIISEYYFMILDTAFLVIFIVMAAVIFKSSKFGRYLVVLFFVGLLARNAVFILTHQDYDSKGYLERKAVATYISEDAKQKGFPCVSVSYIAKPGEDMGFRYIFYLQNLHINQPISGSPVYTIVSPVDLAPESIEKQFGAIGIISPQTVYDLKKVVQSCSGQNSNLTDPLFGYTE